MRKYAKLVAILVLSLKASVNVQAEESGGGASPGSPVGRKGAPAPLGIFGADTLEAGRFAVSLSTNLVRAAGSRIGLRPVSPEYIVATTPWFFDPTKPVRLVPKSVLVWTRSASLAYGVTNDLMLAFSAGLVRKDLAALTFAGGRGVIRLGESATETAGVADFETAAVYRVYNADGHRFLVSIGTTLPTASHTSTFTLLQPDGRYATTRAFYAMQPGTGTFDLLPGATYAGVLDKWSWGVSYRVRAPLAANPDGWRFGALHEFHGWLGYSWTTSLTTTCRVTGAARGPLRGFDPLIRGRAQSANPHFYGGQRVELFLGATVGGSLIGYDAASLAIEAGVPIYQNLNGPQISRNWNISLALRHKI